MGDPVVRRTFLTLPGTEPRTEPISIALLTDMHVEGPNTPPSRLSRIVEQVNALSPDLVLIARGFVSDKRSATTHG